MRAMFPFSFPHPVEGTGVQHKEGTIALMVADDGTCPADAFVVYAPNVGGGGGLVLLRELLHAQWPVSRLTAILDRRGRAQLGELGAGINVHWVDSSVRGRLRAERLLSRIADAGTLVLCFHNLPPMLSVAGRVICYVQNANLVGLIAPSHLSGWVRIRCAMERFIARRFRRRVERYAVQTPTMAAALRSWYGPDVPPIDILPFAPANLASVVDAGGDVRVQAGDTSHRWDFLYVSDGSFHKNHRCLFAAWRLLADQGLRPSLAVTLHPERDADLQGEVREMALKGVRVEDLGQLPHTEVLAAYGEAGALIFPSYAESLGMPLIEAQAAGLPILAPELDYVRDVCEPAVTFDAGSPRSIARAVRRFLERLDGEAVDRVVPLSASAFVDAICDPGARNKG